MRLLPALLVLAACAEAPSLGARISEAERLAPPPALQPLGPLLARADHLPAAPGFDATLRAEAAALQGRAAALPATADPTLAARASDLQARAAALPATPSTGDAQRLQDLQARAEALRLQGLTQAERDRLLGAGS